MGTRVSSVQANFRQGAVNQTDRDLDVLIEGKGFFPVLDPRGEIYYSRAGNFSKNANGNLVIGSALMGRFLLTLPEKRSSDLIHYRKTRR